MQRYIRNKTKQLLSLLMVLALLCTCLPQLSLPARAEDEPDPLIGADEVVLEEITYSGTRIETMRMLYRLAGEPEVEDMSCLDQFTDLDPEIYLEEALRAVAWAVSNRIASGTSQSTFGPEHRTNRAQAIYYIWVAAGRPNPSAAENPFTDVKPGKYYTDAVLWFLENQDWIGIACYGNLFEPQRSITEYKLFCCQNAQGDRIWKVRIGRRSPSCGEHLTWHYDEDSCTLVVEGYGPMDSYLFNSTTSSNAAPWNAYQSDMLAVSLPEGLTSVGEGAFAYCTMLDSVTIPEGVTIIGDSAFKGCRSLSSVRLPNGLTNLSYRVFSDCTGLSSVKLPEGLVSIGASAFQNCISLKSVTLPATLEYIYSGDDSEVAYGAFQGCTNLTALVFRNANTYVQTYGDFDSSEDLADGDYYISTEFVLGVPGKTILYSGETTAEPIYQSKDDMNDYKLVCKNIPTYAAHYHYSLYRLCTFSDVTEGSYYEIPVAWAVGKGITSGTGDGQFSPKKTCTREQVMTFLYAAEGKPGHTATESPFTDVKPGKYYYHPVMWAVEKKITGGVSDTLFGVGKPCTREQAVTFLWKAKGSPQPEGTECPFTDVKPGYYYYKPVLWAVENGITGGVSTTSFGVGQSCTRAQIVTFLYKAYVE